MKDKNGIMLKTGDLMAEVVGCSSVSRKSFSSVKLWEVPKIRDGRGIEYTSEGKKTHFYWADASEAIKLNHKKLPEGFVFAFRHGLNDIDIEDGLMSLDIHEAIAKSDWKENALTPEIVEEMKVISDIKIISLVDVAEKWDSIFCSARVPHQVVKKIMELVEYKCAVPVNGEIGIAALQNDLAFFDVYKTLKKWKDSGCLLDKCKEIDDERGWLLYE
jgi:hypothetical protein